MHPDYEHMSLADLSRLRNALPPDDPRQGKLAYYDHMAFARQLVKDHPVLGPMELLLAIPGYTAAKKMHLIGARTPGSLSEMDGGYKGMWQGIDQNMHGHANMLAGKPVSTFAPSLSMLSGY